MAYHQLTTEERYMIATLRQQGCPVPEIAAELGRHPSTIRRELQRNATPHDGAYRPSMAVEMTNGRRSRSRRNARYGAAAVCAHRGPAAAELESGADRGPAAPGETFG